MARSETKWYCEKCAKQYDTEELATKCENQHLIPNEVADPTYSTEKQNSIPTGVTITFNDGTKQKYFKQ